MSFIDIIIILFLLWGAIEGFLKGLIIEVATLASLILGVYLAIRYSPYTEEILRDFLNVTSRYIAYIALAVTFVVVVSGVYVIGKLLTKLVDILTLGWVNKFIGSVFGIVKYMVIVCVLLLILDAVNSKFEFLSEETLQKSKLFFPFLNLQFYPFLMMKYYKTVGTLYY